MKITLYYFMTLTESQSYLGLTGDMTLAFSDNFSVMYSEAACSGPHLYSASGAVQLEKSLCTVRMGDLPPPAGSYCPLR